MNYKSNGTSDVSEKLEFNKKKQTSFKDRLDAFQYIQNNQLGHNK